MRPGCAALLTAALFLPGLPAIAEPKVTETIKTYHVSGNTPRDVRADINRERKKEDAVGAEFDSVTRWNVRWRFDVSRADQGCSIANASVTVDIVVTIPELAPGVAADVRKRFDQYIENLLIHERGHGKNGIDAARAIEAAFAALPPQPTCPQAGAAANELGRSLIASAREQGKEYDTQTRHGRTQGVHFP